MLQLNNNTILTEKYKLFFILFSNINIKINYNEKQDNMNILFIKHQNNSDTDIIKSWLNNDFTYVIIILDVLDNDYIYKNLLDICKSVINQKKILILYNTKLYINTIIRGPGPGPKMTTKQNSIILLQEKEKTNIDFNERYIIPFVYHTYEALYYPSRFNNFLFIRDSENKYNSDLNLCWFYKYIINKFYSCGTGRLRQLMYTPTCYANSSFNSILLSKPFRSLLFSLLKYDLKKDPSLLKNIKKPLDFSKSCPNTKVLFYTLLYNLQCFENIEPKKKIKT
jgi:hypothetical protein